MVTCRAQPTMQAVEERNRGLRLNAGILNIPSSCFTFLMVDGWKSEYISVDLLLRHLSRKSKSEASRRAYLSRLYSFCVCTGMDPDRLIAMPKETVEAQLQDYADQFNDGKHSLRYANTVIHLLKTFFTVNGFRGIKALEVEGYHMSARYRKRPEYIPKKNEIYLMADSACSLRDRAFILTAYSSGLRNSTIRALLFKDVEQELARNIANIMLPVYPEMKLVEPNACKNNIPYYSFICDEATQALKLYLRERREKCGAIKSDEPLFASDYNQIPREERSAKTMSARQLQLVVKQAAQRASIRDWQHVTPQCLRKAFETVLHSELIEGGRLDPKIQEFLMGHILPGSEDAYFDRTKIELLRSEYGKLDFGRIVIKNKFKVLRAAVVRAFESSGIDADEVLEEYFKTQFHGLQ